MNNSSTSFSSHLFNDPIRSYQTEQKHLSDRAEAMRPLVKACQEAITRAEMIASIVINTKGGRPQLVIVTTPKKLEELVPLFRELAKEGIHTNKTKPYVDRSMFGLLGMREYDLGQVTVSAMIFDKSDDEPAEGRCRLVQTGTETVPVFEMKCD